MNRKLERIIGWIGVGLTVIYMLLFVIGLIVGGDKLSKLLLKQDDTSMSPAYLQDSMMFEAGGLLVIAIVAAIAVALSKKNRIIAGVILLIVAIIGIFFSNFLASILFFIVGVMLFVRRSKAKHEEDVRYDREHSFFDAVPSKDDQLDEKEKKGKIDPNLENKEHYTEEEQKAKEKREAHQDVPKNERQQGARKETYYTEAHSYDKNGNEVDVQSEETIYEDKEFDPNDLTQQRRRTKDERPTKHDLDGEDKDK